MKKIKVIAVLAAIVSVNMAMGQEKEELKKNPNSVNPIDNINQMYKVTLWRRIDLREKQNQPLFSKGNEITKHLIDGVKSGILEPFDNDSLTHKITLEEFNKRMTKKFEGGGLSKEEVEAGFSTQTDDDGWGGSSTPAPAAKKDLKKTSTSQTSVPVAKPAAAIDGYELLASDFYILELKEDWIFDKQRSRQYFDIQSITIKIPAELSGDGLEKELASFKYKELVPYFKLNPNCIWYNAANTAQHKNLADAFELRLFNGRIIKKSNPNDKYLDQVYKSPKEALQKSQQLEYELLEFENNLWEY